MARNMKMELHTFSYTVSVEKLWTQNTRIIHDVWRLLILSNEEKTNDYENFEKGMIYMKILKKGGVVEKRGEEETKSMPHAPVLWVMWSLWDVYKVWRYQMGNQNTYIEEAQTMQWQNKRQKDKQWSTNKQILLLLFIYIYQTSNSKGWIFIHKVRSAQMVTSIKQSPVFKGHIFPVLS